MIVVAKGGSKVCIVGRQQIFNINMHDVHLDSVGAAPESSQEVFGADLYLMEIDPALHSSHEPRPRIRHFK